MAEPSFFLFWLSLRGAACALSNGSLQTSLFSSFFCLVNGTTAKERSFIGNDGQHQGCGRQRNDNDNDNDGERERKIEKEAGGKKWERGKEAWTGKSVKCVRSKARHPPSRWCNTFSDGAANNQSRSSLFTGASPRRTGQWRSGAPARRFRGTSNLPRRRWVPLTLDIFVFINIPHCISLYIYLSTPTHTHIHTQLSSGLDLSLIYYSWLDWIGSNIIWLYFQLILFWPDIRFHLRLLSHLAFFGKYSIFQLFQLSSETLQSLIQLLSNVAWFLIPTSSPSPLHPSIYIQSVYWIHPGEKTIHVYHLLDSNLFFLHLPPSLSHSQFTFYVFYHFALANVIAVGHLDWIRIDSMCARLYLCAFYHFSNFIILIFWFFRPYFFSISRGFRFGMPNECCLSSFVLFFHYSTFDIFVWIWTVVLFFPSLAFSRENRWSPSRYRKKLFFLIINWSILYSTWFQKWERKKSSPPPPIRSTCFADEFGELMGWDVVRVCLWESLTGLRLQHFSIESSF